MKISDTKGLAPYRAWQVLKEDENKYYDQFINISFHQDMIPIIRSKLNATKRFVLSDKLYMNYLPILNLDEYYEVYCKQSLQDFNEILPNGLFEAVSNKWHLFLKLERYAICIIRKDRIFLPEGVSFFV